MKSRHGQRARKRPVNLTLDAELVSQAREVTDNLSGVVESLLAGFVSSAHRERVARSKLLEEAVARWNRFDEDNGSIADEYSPL